MRFPVLALLGCLASIAAQAEDRPRALPDRDVVVTYRNGDRVERMSYSATERMFRVDREGFPGFMLINGRNSTMLVVSEKHQAIAPVPSVLAGTPPWDPAVQLTKVRTTSVAGTACTEWQMTMPAAGSTPSSDEGKVCLTSNGIVLRFGDPVAGRTATAVTYQPQNASRFKVPANYRTLTGLEAALLQ